MLQRFAGGNFETFPNPIPKVVSGSFQESILKHFQAQAQKSLQTNANRQADRQPGDTFHCHWRAMLWLSLASYGCHWRAMAVVGEIWLSLARYGCHWRAMAAIGELWLSLVSYGCHWRAMAVIDELWLSLMRYDCHWRAMAEQSKPWQ